MSTKSHTTLVHSGQDICQPAFLTSFVDGLERLHVMPPVRDKDGRLVRVGGAA